MLTDCPLDFSASNFTLAASACSNNETRGTCCRYINALIAISISRYANLTSNIGAPPELRETCLRSVSQSLELYGTPRNATVFCGLGTKIRVHYQCKGRKTVTQMLKSPRFGDVSSNCIMPLSVESNCKKCLNASILYLHRLVGDEANVTLSNCRDATFTTIASQVDIVSAVDTASCFFGIPGIGSMPGTQLWLISLLHFIYTDKQFVSVKCFHFYSSFEIVCFMHMVWNLRSVQSLQIM